MTSPDMDAPGGPQTRGGGGGFLTRSLGPLPMWAWLGVGLGGLLAVTSWQKNKKAQATQTSQQGTLPTTSTASGSTPASLIPQFVNQVYDNPIPPVINVTNTQTANTPVTVNNQPPSPPTPNPGPPGPPPPKPPPPQPQGQWVTVGVWNSTNAPWNSTLWGIANHIYGNGALYGKIFQANKVGVMRPDGTAGFISNPDLIHPNDRIWVPA